MQEFVEFIDQDIKFENEKSFFEHMAIADVERIHSEFIAWLLSDSCQGIDVNKKQELLKFLFGNNAFGSIEKVRTEENHKDIIIETQEYILIIENKIKSTQSKRQLSNYKADIEKKCPDKNHAFTFLTLVPEYPDSEGWHHVIYHQLYDWLKGNIDLYSLEKEPNTKHQQWIGEYCLYLNRLLATYNQVIATPYKFEYIFNGAHNYQGVENENEEDAFIVENKLKIILNAAYLAYIRDISSLDKYSARIETAQTAYLTFATKDFQIENIEAKSLFSFNYSGYKYDYEIEGKNHTELRQTNFKKAKEYFQGIEFPNEYILTFDDNKRRITYRKNIGTKNFIKKGSKELALDLVSELEKIKACLKG